DSVAACPPDLTVYPIMVGPADIWLPPHESLVPDAWRYRRKFPPIGGAGHSHFCGDRRARTAGRRRTVHHRVAVLSVPDHFLCRRTACRRDFPASSVHAFGPSTGRGH